MAAKDLAGTALPMLEVAKRHDPDGSLAQIAELATEKNEALNDLLWLGANGKDSHQFTQRISEPTGTWGKANKGVNKESSRTRQVSSRISILESYNYIDERVLKRFDDQAAARLQEDVAFVAGMTKSMMNAVFYGSKGTNPDMPIGLSNRDEWSALTTGYTVGGGGTGSDLSSIWLVKHSSTDGLFFFYPENDPTQMVESNDMGLQLVEDDDGLPYRAWVTYHKWNIGFDVKVPNSVIRYANIETAGSSNIFDEDKIIDALTLMDSMEGIVLYMNRTIFAQLLKAAKDKTTVFYNQSPEYPGPRIIRTFMGIPVRIVDQIGNNETAIA